MFEFPSSSKEDFARYETIGRTERAKIVVKTWVELLDNKETTNSPEESNDKG